MNIKFFPTIITKGIGIALIATMNSFSPLPAFGQRVNCSNYWTNPNTGKTECFNGEMNLIVEPKPVTHKPVLGDNSYYIGGKKITIPVPDGYARVTEEMHAFNRLMIQMTHPTSDRLASYISESDASIAREGKLPFNDAGRIFVVQVDKSLKGQLISSQHFAEFKSIIKRNNKEIFKSVVPELQAHMDKTSQEFSKEFNTDLAFQVSQIIPLDSHYEADNILSFSMYMTGVAEESAEEYIISSTVTLVNISGKVLTLSCSGTQSDLEWTRNASRVWLEKIIASNRGLN